MKKIIVLLFAFSFSLLAFAKGDKPLEDFPVLVEFEDGTVKEMIAGSEYSLLDVSAVRLADPKTKKEKFYDIELIKSITYQKGDGVNKVSYLFLYLSASASKAKKKLNKYKSSVYCVYEGKNINVYTKQYSDLTSKTTYIYFQRVGEYGKFVMRASKDYGIYTSLPLKKGLLNYFQEDTDFYNRILADEFELDKKSDWSIGYMVEIAKAYDESK